MTDYAQESKDQPQYGTGSDGQYRVGGKTLQEAQAEARQQYLDSHKPEAYHGPGQYSFGTINNINQYNNYVNSQLPRQANDAAEIARYHWQTQMKSQEGYNLPALRAGQANADETSTTDGSLRAGAPTGGQVVNGQSYKPGEYQQASQNSWQSTKEVAAAQAQREQNFYAKYPAQSNGVVGSTQQGQFAGGSQVVAYAGQRAKTAGEMIGRLQGANFNPGRLTGPMNVSVRTVPQKTLPEDFLGANPLGVDEKIYKSGNQMPINGVTSSNSFGNSPSVPVSIRPVLSQASQVRRAGENTDGYEKRLTTSIDRQENYFNSPGLKRVGSLANWATGGVNFNPFSRNFLIETPVERRGFVGKVAQGTLYSGMAFPQLTVGYGLSTGEKVAAAAEGIYVGGSARRNVIREAFVDAPKKVATEQLNPTTPQGFINVGSAVVLGGIGARASMTTPKSITVDPIRGAVAETRVTENAVSGMSTVQGTATVNYEYGPGNMFKKSVTTPVQSEIIFNGARVPGTNDFGVRVEGVTAVPLPKGTRYVNTDMAGGYNADTNTLGLRSPKSQGDVYFSQGGKSAPAMNEGVGLIEKAPGRFVTLQTNDAGITRVTGTGRSTMLLEQNSVTQARVVAVGNEAVLFNGERVFSQTMSQTLSRAQQRGGANTELFNQGFDALENVGAYRDPELSSKPYPRDINDLLKNRRGSLSSTELDTTTPVENVKVSDTTFEVGKVVEQPKPFDVSNIPIREQFPKPRGMPGYASLGALGARYRDTSGFDRSPANMLKPVQYSREKQVPITVPESSFRFQPKGKQDTIPQSDTAFRFQPVTAQEAKFTPRPPVPGPLIPKGPSPNTPDISIPPFGVPSLYKPGSSPGGSLGKARKYVYAPSLSAAMLHIHGKAPKLLTGIELRPLAIKRKLKVKRGR